MAGEVHAQSSFYFSNMQPSAGIDAPVFDGNGIPLSGTNYVAMLYGGTTVDSLTPARSRSHPAFIEAPVPFTFMPLGKAGYFPPSIVGITTVDCGGLAWLQVRAWDARLGATFEDVMAQGIGGYGQSELFQSRGGFDCTIPGPPGNLFGLKSFSLLPVVPEPSPALLFLLGLPWLVWRCRRFK